jgi:hypothetical protein
MDDRLRELAENRYGQKEFLSALFDLALEEQWFDLQHLIQHDMAKAILADYSQEIGKDYLNQEIFYDRMLFKSAGKRFAHIPGYQWTR